jgi:hypothetical protein
VEINAVAYLEELDECGLRQTEDCWRWTVGLMRQDERESACPDGKTQQIDS